MKTQLGIVDCTNEEYHASEGISRSKLWKFKELPYKYWYEYLSGECQKEADKESYILGNLVHTMLLEPEKTQQIYCEMPDFDRRTKIGKLSYEKFIETFHGRTFVKPTVWLTAEFMNDRLLDNDIVQNLLFNGILDHRMVETSIYWKHEPTGLICKARPDIWKNTLVADLKTTQDASERAFQSSACKYGYFLQAGMIHEALKSIGKPLHSFIFICIEKTAPYSICIYMLEDEALQFGIEMFHSLMTRLAICLEKNVWPDYGVQKISVPKYALNKEDNYDD